MIFSYVEKVKLSVWLRDVFGAKTVPRNHANKNKTAKTKENMQILAIKSIENISKNAIHIA